MDGHKPVGEVAQLLIFNAQALTSVMKFTNCRLNASESQSLAATAVTGDSLSAVYLKSHPPYRSPDSKGSQRLCNSLM